MSVKCFHCGTPHTNKSKESKYQEIGKECFSCAFILESLSHFVEAINKLVPINVGRVNRKLTIIKFKIEKV